MIKGGTGRRSLLFLFLQKKDFRLLTAASFQGESSGKKMGGGAFIYIIKLPSMAVLTFRLHWGKQDVSPRINGSASIEVIWKMRLFFNGEHWSFLLGIGKVPILLVSTIQIPIFQLYHGLIQ